MTQEPLHVLELEIQNVRKIRALKLTPNGQPVEIAGRNEAGKSTVLDCIRAAASTGLTDAMITEGEKAAGVVVKTEHYTIRHKKTRGQPARLDLLGPAGEKFPSPRAALDALCAPTSFAFDLSAFERLNEKELDALLRQLAGVDTTRLDAERARVFAERTQVGRDHKQALTLLGPAIDAPDAEISVEALLEEQRSLQRVVAAYADQRRQATELRANATRASQAVETAQLTVERLQRELALASSQLDEAQAAEADAALRASQAEEAAADLVDPDLTTITDQIRAAAATNSAVQQKRARQQREKAALALAEQYDALTTQLATLDEQKEAALAGATFPVAGLELRETGVYYHGAPVSEASRSAKRRLAFAVNMALKPRLAVALWEDASLLDAASKADVLALCQEFGVQPWFEVVGDGGDGAVIIEDGAVVGADVPAGEAVAS